MFIEENDMAYRCLLAGILQEQFFVGNAARPERQGETA